MTIDSVNNIGGCVKKGIGVLSPLNSGFTAAVAYLSCPERLFGSRKFY